MERCSAVGGAEGDDGRGVGGPHVRAGSIAGVAGVERSNAAGKRLERWAGEGRGKQHEWFPAYACSRRWRGAWTCSRRGRLDARVRSDVRTLALSFF
jgi:hypothetical protein